MKRIAGILMVCAAQGAAAAEFHVAVTGDDAHDGTAAAPLRSIQRAADRARPGDTVTVHAGVYRESVRPPRGGESDSKRIVYRAAPGERVEIKGSEVVTNWTRVKGDVWTATVPNGAFGAFNPYADLIRGDWFNGKGREHHTGAVYLDGVAFDEAARLEDLLDPGSRAPAEKGGVLLNVAWFRAGEGKPVPAVGYAAQEGVRNAPCAEGGECIGWLENGDWARYEGVDLGATTDRIEIRAASEMQGGQVQIRLGAPDGELLGSCVVPNTGGWQSWRSFHATVRRLTGRQTLCLVFRPPPSLTAPQMPLWFGRVEASNTTLWAEFKGVDPNPRLVEANARRTVFYPDQPGRNFITIRGFTMRHAATPWAPPTAEQPGLVGTHWSRGWIIESNVISHSRCVGVSLGKHGDEYDNTSANSAEGYVKTIERAHAHAIPWTKETIGHHVVRDNVISHCEQAGVVGSLGAAFSRITGNVIHDIHVRRLFTGAEMAGIKIHASIDCEIARNRIFRTCRGLWMDWMAQGTRITRNLCYENASEDLFMEVNHGPYLIDNNLFLSPTSLLDMSQGGAFVHNLWAGRLISTVELNRETPYHPAHSTVVAGLGRIQGGDNRFFNNVFIGAGDAPAEPAKKDDRHARVAGYGTWMYDARERPSVAAGNVYLNGARPSAKEEGAVVVAADPQVQRTEGEGSVVLRLAVAPEWNRAATRRITTRVLGKAAVPGVGFVAPDGSSMAVNSDYFGKRRSWWWRPAAGPFEAPGTGPVTFEVVRP